MIREWHVRAVLSSEKNFLIESSKETYFREMHIQNEFWINLRWVHVVKCSQTGKKKMALPGDTIENDK